MVSSRSDWLLFVSRISVSGEKEWLHTNLSQIFVNRGPILRNTCELVTVNTQYNCIFQLTVEPASYYVRYVSSHNIISKYWQDCNYKEVGIFTNDIISLVLFHYLSIWASVCGPLLLILQVKLKRYEILQDPKCFIGSAPDLGAGGLYIVLPNVAANWGHEIESHHPVKFLKKNQLDLRPSGFGISLLDRITW